MKNEAGMMLSLRRSERSARGPLQNFDGGITVAKKKKAAKKVAKKAPAKKAAKKKVKKAKKCCCK
jgi:hypothetical protein